MTLTPFDLVLTLGFLALTIALSTALGLGLTRQWLTAGTRTLLQLGGLGYLLAIAGDGQNIIWALVVTFAVIALGIFNLYQQVQGLPRWVYGAIAVGLGGAILFSTSLIVGIMLRLLPPDLPLIWFAIAAVIATPASHGTTQTALILNRYFLKLQREQNHQQLTPQIPLPHPQSPPSDPPDKPSEPTWVDNWDWEPVTEAAPTPTLSSLASQKRHAIRQGVTPILNGLMAAGITTLPLFLSGQLLGQIPPLTAVSLQIATLFASAFTTLIGAIAAAQALAIAWKHLIPLEKIS